MKNNRFPKIGLRSKNELAKRISSKSFSYDQALALINDVLKNKDKYWYDSKGSKPKDGKYVRSAYGKPLGRLLKLIDRKVLAPNDNLLPPFIYGGVSGSNHVQAAKSLIGKKKKRSFVSGDVTKFFEQIKRDRIFYFFYSKGGCGAQVSNILADLCSVPSGPKGSKSDQVILARGFSTSSRLAIWCSIDIFYEVSWAVKKILKGKDSRLAIFIDDLGVSASNVPKELMEVVYSKIKEILISHDPNQSLELNEKKKTTQSHKTGIEHLGLSIGKNQLRIGRRTKGKIDRIKHLQSKGKISPKLKATKRGLMSYKGYVNDS